MNELLCQVLIGLGTLIYFGLALLGAFSGVMVILTGGPAPIGMILMLWSIVLVTAGIVWLRETFS